MDEIVIGLFLTLLARFIKNPVHAQQYRAQLEHIVNGICVALGVTPPNFGA